jgi:type I restriction enzyme, S subunit
VSNLSKDFIIPNGWRLCKLGDLANYINGRAFKPTEWRKEGIPIIRIENLNNPEATFNYFDGKINSIFEIANGDLLVSWSASLDAFIWTRGKAYLNQHIFKVVHNEDIIIKDFLYFALKEAMKEIRDKVHGATMKHITKPDFEKFQIPIPPITEQKRIVAKLNAQMAAIENARQAAEAQLEAAKVLPRSLLKKMFTREIIIESLKKKLIDISEFLRACSASSSGDVEVPVITTACLTETGFDPSGVKQSTMKKKDADNSIIKKNEILIARSNTEDLVGRISIYLGVPEKIAATDLTIRIWASPDINPQYLAFYLTYLYITGYWKERAGGASGTMKKITRKQISSIEIPVPNQEIQNEIINSLSDQIKIYKKVLESIKKQTEEIANLQAAILRKTLSYE